MQRFVINKKINLNKVNQIKKIKRNAPRACQAIIPKPAWVINVFAELQLSLPGSGLNFSAQRLVCCTEIRNYVQLLKFC